jgi:hypothetical protein
MEHEVMGPAPKRPGIQLEPKVGRHSRRAPSRSVQLVSPHPRNTTSPNGGIPLQRFARLRAGNFSCSGSEAGIKHGVKRPLKRADGVYLLG